MKRTMVKLSVELGIPVEDIEEAYKAYWKFIRTNIENLPLKQDLTKEEFHKLRTSFNIPNLGKFSCTYQRYVNIKTINSKLNDKYKKDKSDS